MFATERQQASLGRARTAGRVDVVALAGPSQVLRIEQKPRIAREVPIGTTRRPAILTDHTTFEVDAFTRFRDFADVDVTVSDSALGPDLTSDAESAGPRVVPA